MYKIVRKQELNASVTLMEIEAPFVARKAKAGQFIIFRIDEMGERVPLTIAGYDREKGTVTIIFQKVGFSTNALGALKEGDYIHDFVGPLGKPTPVEGKKKVCVVGGGVGCAIALPIARELHEQGCVVHSVVGFRNKDLLILEDEFKACSDELRIMTDDGSYGTKGVVTAALDELVAAGNQYDLVITIDGREAKSYSSQGQTRTAALALKLAEREIYQNATGEYPVLLLDDVLSELDRRRQDFVLNRISAGQVMITCCEDGISEKLRAGAVFHIQNGEKSAETH